MSESGGFPTQCNSFSFKSRKNQHFLVDNEIETPVDNENEASALYQLL